MYVWLLIEEKMMCVIFLLKRVVMIVVEYFPEVLDGQTDDEKNVMRDRVSSRSYSRSD